MALGDAVLLIVGVHLIHSDRHLSGLNAAFWLTVLLTVNARFTDTRYFAGTDGLVFPSPRSDWKCDAIKCDAIKMVSLAGIAWFVMRLAIEIRRSPVIGSRL